MECGRKKVLMLGYRYTLKINHKSFFCLLQAEYIEQLVALKNISIISYT